MSWNTEFKLMSTGSCDVWLTCLWVWRHLNGCSSTQSEGTNSSNSHHLQASSQTDGSDHQHLQAPSQLGGSNSQHLQAPSQSGGSNSQHLQAHTLPEVTDRSQIEESQTISIVTCDCTTTSWVSLVCLPEQSGLFTVFAIWHILC